MVIGVEGNVNVGKTTFIKEYYKDYDVLCENKFNPSLNDFERQLFYLKQEVERKSALSFNTVLDRTIISIAVYTLYSNVLDKADKKKICGMIENCISKKEIIIPDCVNLIVYPYKLICQNHNKLVKEKHTQEGLVDYNYYVNYNAYFANRYRSYVKNLITNDYRQVLVYDKSIFDKVTYEIGLDSKVILDGCPAIGKSTIGMKQKKYNYIEEFKYKKYTIEDYKNQIDSIVERINILDKENILLDTSFLMGITHLFYNKKTSKKFKLKMIDEIISKIKLNSYLTKIVYLTLDKEKIIERKERDKNKKRLHFYDNLNYLESEIAFYEVLNRRLETMSNIHFIDASTDVKSIINKIIDIPDKPLLLADLFYEMKEAIKDGEL